MWYANMHAHTEDTGALPYHSTLYPLGARRPTELRDRLAPSPGNPPDSSLSEVLSQACASTPGLFVGFVNLNSALHAQIQNVLTHGAISPLLLSFSKDIYKEFS